MTDSLGRRRGAESEPRRSPADEEGSLLVRGLNAVVLERFTDLLPFMIRYGYAMVFGAALLEFGCVIPFFGTLTLLAAGVMVRLHLLHPIGVIASAVAAMLIGDAFWYRVGRRRGLTFLKIYCRLTLGSGRCVTRTEDFFERHGAKALILAKFVTGFSTFAAPMAGWRGMSWRGFLIYDAIGALLWSVPVVVFGYLFADQIEWAVRVVTRFDRALFGVVLVVLIAYVGMKMVRRRRFGDGEPYFMAGEGE